MIVIPKNKKQVKKQRGGRRANAGRKKGFESEMRKTGFKTKVKRIPEHWNVDEIMGVLEIVKSHIETAEIEIAESKARSAKGEASNRYWKTMELIEQLNDTGLDFLLNGPKQK